MKTAKFASIVLAIMTSMGAAMAQEPQTGYAPVNGIEMYYEIHGEGEPLVLLHGAYMNIDANWSQILPALAEEYQVVAMEFQAHGRTNDRDTPITYENMADDVAALLDHLEIESANVFGYSMGGGVGLQLAIRHPEKVERLISASVAASYDGYGEGFEEMIGSITPEFFAGTPMETEYQRLSPNPSPEGFATLVEKLKQLDLTDYDWMEDAAAIDVPVLLIAGDADVVTLDHMVELYKAMGGTQNGDINGLSDVQLMILPGSSHIGVMYNPLNVEILKLAVPHFLEAELPPPPPSF